MKHLLYLFMLCSTIFYAQDRTQNLGDFNELKIFNGLSVDIEKSDKASIEISGVKTNNVIVKNVNGILKLSLKFPESFNPDKVKVKVYYNQDLEILDANEGAAIFSEDPIKQESLTVKTQEGAYIRMSIEVKYLSVKAVTGGSIKLTGNTVNQDVDVTTGGVYEAYDLISEDTDIIAASGANAQVNVSNQLEAKVRFGGRIYYKGNPEKVSTRKVMGGIIINKG